MVQRSARRGRTLAGIGAVCAFVLTVLPGLPGAAVSPAGLPPTQVLQPGLVGGIHIPLPVNVVFVGYERGAAADQVRPEAFAQQLPSSTSSLVLGSLPWVIRFNYVGFDLDYRPLFADQQFEDEFFAELVDLGEPVPFSNAMASYNEQEGGRDVVDPIGIDATAVEHWLGDHAPELGIDPADPTVFLINWFDRPDFRFHVYRKTGDIDPDSGIDHGAAPGEYLIGYGGTAADDPETGNGEVRRVWFHDLSAGPNVVNWNITDADLTGDGVLDYRMPPVWDYGTPGGYRDFDDLTGDLAKLVRYVATNLYFAPASVYKPAISPPLLHDTVSIDVNQFTPPGRTPYSVATGRALEALTSLQPGTTFRTTHRQRTFDGQITTVFDCWSTAFTDPTFVGDSCYGRRGAGYAYYDMFFWSWDRWSQLTTTDTDHSVPVLLFDFDDDRPVPLAGLADGQPYYEFGQAEVIAVTSPRFRAAGAGPSHLLTHEVGHHLGLTHPHDGVDVEGGFYYFPDGPFYFAWSGDEVSSTMSYARIQSDFSQFDQDAMNRWLTLANLNYANQVLAGIAASPRAGQVGARIQAADGAALQAVLAYVLSNDYATARELAELAYDGVVAAALSIGVPVEPPAAPADARSRSLQAFFGDPIPPAYIDPQVLRGRQGELPARALDEPTVNWAELADD